MNKIHAKNKIFHLIASVDLGGALIVAYNIIQECNKLLPTQFDFVMLELFATKSTFSTKKKKEFKNNNIEIISLTKLSKRLSLLLAPFKLINLLKKESSVIIHSHTDLPDFVLSVALRLLNRKNKRKIKIVRTIHNTQLWPTHKKVGRFVERQFNNDTIVGVSEAALIAYNNLRKESKLKESKKQQLIYNGCPVLKNIEFDYPLDKNKISIAICGRFDYQKGTDFIVAFLKKHNHIFKDLINFIFIGEGALKKQVLQLQQEKNVKIYLPIAGIAYKIHAFDYVLMPSRFEGLVLMSIEASLAKVPVIASKVDGLKDTLPEDWPLFFRLEQENQLMKILNDIIQNKIDKNSLGEKAFAFASTKFSITKMTNSYIDIYNQLAIVLNASV